MADTCARCCGHAPGDHSSFDSRCLIAACGCPAYVAPTDDTAPTEHRTYETGWVCDVDDPRDTVPTIDAAYLEWQREFSLRTFGPGLRTDGVLDHITKEIEEVRKDPTDLGEWVDLIILSFDGAQRLGVPVQDIIDGVHAKLARNEARTWPDWRTAEPGKAIEHDRSAE